MSSSLVSHLQTIHVHNNDVTTVDLCNNLLATGSNDKTIAIFQFKEVSAKYVPLPGSPLHGHNYGITQVRFSPCGEYLVSTSRDGKIIIWHVKKMTSFRILQHDSGEWIRAVCFSKRNSYLATAGESCLIKLWNYTNFSCIKTLIGTKESSITCLKFSANNELLISADLDGRIESWSAATPHAHVLCTIEDAHDLGVFDCDIIPFSVCYPVLSEEVEKALNLNLVIQSDSLRRTAKEKAAEISNIYAKIKEMLSELKNSIESQSFLLSCGNENLAKLWLLRENGEIEFLRHYAGHSGVINGCRFITERLVLSVGSDQKLHIWNKETGVNEFVYPSQQKCLLSCSYSGSVIAVGSNDHTLFIWQLKGPQETPLVSFHNKNPCSWTVHDVRLWFDENFPLFAYLLNENKIDGAKLLNMTNEDLYKMGISDPAIQENILASITGILPEDFRDASEKKVPHEFLCPIMCDLMFDPVIAADGFTYERSAITSWFAENCPLRSPVTNEPLESGILIPNKILDRLIRDFKSKR